MRAVSRSRTGVLLLLALLAEAGCSWESMMRRVVPAEVDQFARAYLDTLFIASADQAARAFSPRLAQETGVLDSLRSLQRELAGVGRRDSTHLVNGHASFPHGSSVVRRVLSYQVYGSNGIALVELAIVEELGWHGIDAVRGERLAQPLQVVNGFWQNFRPAQAVAFFLTLAVVGYSVVAAVLVARTPMPKRWWWFLATMIGIGKFNLNWSTGETGTQLSSLQFLSASIGRIGLVGPWWVSVSFPLGAIVALQRRQQALTASIPPTTTSSETATGASDPPTD